MIVVTLNETELFAVVQKAVKEAISEMALPLANSDATVSKPITTQELCEYLNVTEPTILRWRKKGRIPFFTIGTAVRFNLPEVLKALD